MKNMKEVKNYIDVNITVKELALLWISHKQDTVKISTVASYHNVLQLYIIPAFGTSKITELEEQQIQEKINEWYHTCGLSKSTLKLILTILKSMQTFFLSKQSRATFIPVNLKNIVLPNSPSSMIEVFTKEEQQAIVKHLFKKPRKQNAGIAIALLAGLRIGEICGLKWSDIDMDKGIIKVRRTVQRISNIQKTGTSLVVTPPKSVKSTREVPLVTSLKIFLANIEPSGIKDNIYITSGKTTPTEPRTLRATYARLLDILGIRYLKFHGLRHTFATTAKNCGMPIEHLSKILGHESVQITMDLYLHPNIDDLKRSMLQFENNWF